MSQYLECRRYREQSFLMINLSNLKCRANQIAGVILVQGWSGNEIRIDVFDGDQRQIGGSRPSVISSASVSKPGAYEISVPKGNGKYWIGAYVDQNGDGRPGKQDPSGWYAGNPISASQATAGVELVLSVPDDPIPR